VSWIPSARWVEDGNIWTSSGVSAGTDLGYAFVSHIYGEKVSEYLGYVEEYQRWEHGSAYDPFAKIWEVPGAS
jgi:transcriptional regulator GlxA family with amidase domain